MDELNKKIEQLMNLTDEIAQLQSAAYVDVEKKINEVTDERQKIYLKDLTLRIKQAQDNRDSNKLNQLLTEAKQLINAN